MQDRPYVQKAIPHVLSYFEDKYGRPLKRPYYIRQMQVLLENDFFPWIVYHALMHLVERGRLVKKRYVSRHKRKLVYFYNRRLHTRKSRPIMMTHIKSSSKIVDSYATAKISKYLGKHLEALVKSELRAQGFEIVGVSSNEYNGKE